MSSKEPIFARYTSAFSLRRAGSRYPTRDCRPIYVRPKVVLLVVVLALLVVSLLMNVALLSLALHTSQAMTQPLNISFWSGQAFLPINADRGNCTASTVSSDLFVPIFVLSRDRVRDLKETLHSYKETLSSAYEIIILDHNSTYPPMLKYLNHLQKKRHVMVHTLRQPVWDDALKQADRIIQQYLQQHPHIQYYVVTDPDVALRRSHGDILLFFAGILASCPDVNVVGPHLQISDIPPQYTVKYQNQSAYQWESQYWKTVPYMATFKGVGYHFAEQLIDTTFAMRRRSQHFARITCPCIRTYAPYAAVHLDWYLDSAHLPPDKKYYLSKSFQKTNH